MSQRRLARGLLPVACWLLVASGAAAQRVLGPPDRPPLEPFPSERAPEPLDLPPAPEVADEGVLGTGLIVTVRTFVVEGSTVFSQQELAQITLPYTGRPIGAEQLLAVRDAITQLYVERGYITSGAVIPDQTVEDGIVRIQLTEGTLVDVVVEGTSRFRPRYFRDRLMRAGHRPVNVLKLEERLQLFQQDALVERVAARLEPGELRGQSILFLDVTEGRSYGATASFVNNRNPNVGSTGGQFSAGIANLLGHADRLTGYADVTRGFWEYNFRYELPLNSYDTQLALTWENAESDIINDDFNRLDIVSKAWTGGIELRHPLVRTLRHELWLGVAVARRRSKSTLLGQAIAFVGDDAAQKTSVLRFVQDYTWRAPRNVIALRSTESLGLDVLGADGTGEPKSQFVSWLAQVQWAHRLPEVLLGSQIVFRTDLQLASDPLPILERLALGGVATVRGYRENAIVRDNGVISSLELRIPLLRDRLDADLVQLAGFLDVGRGWDERSSLGSKTLWGTGLGLRIFPYPGVEGEIYWAENLTGQPDTSGNRDLQDDGIYFRLTLRPFDTFSARR